jgi:hypothetical protein
LWPYSWHDSWQNVLYFATIVGLQKLQLSFVVQYQYANEIQMEGHIFAYSSSPTAPSALSAPATSFSASARSLSSTFFASVSRAVACQNEQEN